MSKSETILKWPYETNITVHIVNDDGVKGDITISLSMGDCPTDEMIHECLQKARETCEKHDCRLQNRKEFFNTMIQQRLGSTENFYCPGGEEWDQ